MRDYGRVLDGKSLPALLRQVADKYPDQYREISHKLLRLGSSAVQEQGGHSFGIRHLRKSVAAEKLHDEIRAEVKQILRDVRLTPQQKNDAIVLATGNRSESQQSAILAEASKAGNPLARQVFIGARGKPANLVSLLGGDLLYTDHRDNVIPIPVLRSYGQGLSPAEFWAGTYGARKGIVDVKQATANAGFFAKQVTAASHRLMVTGDDSGEYDEASPRGMVVPVTDADNEGALLAKDFGPYKRNTPLTPKIQADLRRRGFSDILIRSPIIGGSPEGGVYAYDVGVREGGKIPGRGEFVGIQSAGALSEPISQGTLSSKHSGGVAGQSQTTSGFAALNALVQVPQRMPGGAAHSTEDGLVDAIQPAPAGGHYVTIGGKQHYVPTDRELKVKLGDAVEAGDVLSSGLPNPGVVTQYKGVGEGRRYFTQIFRDTLKASGISAHRRNVELLARGLLNHVQLTAETDNHVADDIVPYSTIEHTYRPRSGHAILDIKKAAGKYLERPVLHYTIGTKVRPSVARELVKFGVKNVTVHDEPPPFQPHMVRGMYQMQHDPDFLVQMYGSGLKKSLLTSVARGGRSDLDGSSFVPSLAATTDFGMRPDRLVYKPEPRKPVESLPGLDLSPAVDLPEEKQANETPYDSSLSAATAMPLQPDTSGFSPNPVNSVGSGSGSSAAAANPYSQGSATTNPYSQPGATTNPYSQPGATTNPYAPAGRPTPSWDPGYTPIAGGGVQQPGSQSNPAAPENAVTTGTVPGTPSAAGAAAGHQDAGQTTAGGAGMDFNQLLPWLLMGAMGGGGVGGMLGGRTGAMMGGIGVPLLIYLLQQQGLFSSPNAAASTGDSPQSPQPEQAALTARQRRIASEYGADPEWVANGIANNEAAKLLHDQSRRQHAASPRLSSIPNQLGDSLRPGEELRTGEVAGFPGSSAEGVYDTNTGAWTLRPGEPLPDSLLNWSSAWVGNKPTTVVDRLLERADDYTGAVAPYVYTPQMLRSLVPVAKLPGVDPALKYVSRYAGVPLSGVFYGLDAANKANELMTHGWDGATAIGAAKKRDALDNFLQTFRPGESGSYMPTWGGAFNTLGSTLNLAMQHYSPVENAQLMAGFTGMLADDRGNNYVPITAHERNALPWRKEQRDLNKQLREVRHGMQERGLPLDAVPYADQPGSAPAALRGIATPSSPTTKRQFGEAVRALTDKALMRPSPEDQMLERAMQQLSPDRPDPLTKLHQRMAERASNYSNAPRPGAQLPDVHLEPTEKLPIRLPSTPTPRPGNLLDQGLYNRPTPAVERYRRETPLRDQGAHKNPDWASLMHFLGLGK